MKYLLPQCQLVCFVSMESLSVCIIREYGGRLVCAYLCGTPTGHELIDHVTSADAEIESGCDNLNKTPSPRPCPRRYWRNTFVLHAFYEGRNNLPKTVQSTHPYFTRWGRHCMSFVLTIISRLPDVIGFWKLFQCWKTATL